MSATKDEFRGLLDAWRRRRKRGAEFSVEDYRRVALRLVLLAHPIFAADVAAEGLSRHEGDLELRQLKARALAGSGDSQGAYKILSELLAQGHDDTETLGLLGSTAKGLGDSTKQPDKKRQYIDLAIRHYMYAFRSTSDPLKQNWTSINAAALLAFAGRKSESRELAQGIRLRCVEQTKDPLLADNAKYWCFATLAESLLLLGQLSEAVNWYQRAHETLPRQFGTLSVTRRQALRIAEHLNFPTDAIESCFKLPKVVVFSGHMIDRPGRAVPRFPADAQDAVGVCMNEVLQQLSPLIAVSSAACGSDILFLETALKLDAEVRVVLPYKQEDFRIESVEIVPGTDWSERFDNVLDRATTVQTVSDGKLAFGSLSYDYANQVLLGLAFLRAQHLGGVEVRALTVWDGRPGDGPGGTASTVNLWETFGVPITRIALPRDAAPRVEDHQSTKPNISSGSATAATSDGTYVRAIMFADVKNFSKLSEQQIPHFVDKYMGRVAHCVRESETSLEVRNTWGDALYFVFRELRDAGIFALELRDKLSEEDWTRWGLPEDLTIRIALHAGPLYKCIDPVTQLPTMTGTHASRAARLEPVTTPGQVYASEQFAALSALRACVHFRARCNGQDNPIVDVGRSHDLTASNVRDNL